MIVLVQDIVALLVSLLPLIEGTSTSATTVVIEKIITTLITLIPQAVQWAQELIPEIENIISALKSNTNVTPAQFQALEALESQYDAAFDAAAKAASDPGAN